MVSIILVFVTRKLHTDYPWDYWQGFVKLIIFGKFSMGSLPFTSNVATNAQYDLAFLLDAFRICHFSFYAYPLNFSQKNKSRLRSPPHDDV